MLCSACAEHFTFGHSDSILWGKKNAIQHAVEQNFDESHIDKLQKEYHRYRHALESRNGKSPFPSPWGITEPRDASFLVSHSYPVWQLEKRRHWHELKYSTASNGCGLCARLVAMIQSHTTITVSESATILSTWFLDGGNLIPEWLWIELYDGDFQFMMRFPAAINNVTQREHEPISAPSSNSTKDEACMNFLSSSLQRCLTHHKHCLIRQDGWVPTRLLDVRGNYGDNSCIRLVEREAAQMLTPDLITYVTLSHVWGKTHPLKLTKSNYEEFKNLIKTERLPQCFLDAVYVTRQLGVSYLWIDSLCIIQDSTKDWTQEAATMGKVYRNGLCNIAACDGTTSYHSIFKERNPHAAEPLVVYQEFSDQLVKFTVLPDWVNLTWDVAPLYKRGWAFQERFLSARIMHFSDFPFWECSADLSTEIYTSHRETQSVYFPCLPRPQRAWIYSAKDVDETIYRWWRLVKLYTRCDLTYGSDKLIALGGIASTLSKNVDEPYYAGIWGGKYLIMGLAWRVNGISRCHELGSADYRAPSWSWASHDGPAYLYESRSILNPLIQVISIYIMPRIRDPFGEVSDGKLVLRGFLFEVSCAKYRRQNLKRKGQFHLDYESEEFFEKKIYFLPLAEVTISFQKERSFMGIYIHRTIENQCTGEPTYARIGDCLSMNGGGDGFMLNVPSWERLLKLESPETLGKRLVIV